MREPPRGYRHAGIAGRRLGDSGVRVCACCVAAADAYTAADKLTKPVWLVILGAAVALASILYPVLGVLGMAMSACASGVYLVDVRPKLLEIQGKSR